MRCVVLVLCALAGTGAAASCAPSEEFFLRHNASADDIDMPGAVCGGQCCGYAREVRLRAALQHAGERHAAAAARPVADLLLATRRSLQEHLTALSHQSQNKTAALFAQVYRGAAARAHGPLAALYGAVRAVLRPTLARDGGALLPDPPKDLAATTTAFFRQLFPLAYHNLLRLEDKRFTPEYDACLKDAYDTVQPFGEVPQQLGAALSRSLAGGRALLQGLGAGAAALAMAEQAAARAVAGCSVQLLRAAGCARCRRLDARPCRHYCLNVARGCVGGVAAELEVPWAAFVEAAERLARADADAALRSLDARVSQAVLRALENHALLDTKKAAHSIHTHTKGLGRSDPPSAADSGPVRAAGQNVKRPRPKDLWNLSGRSVGVVRQECGVPKTTAGGGGRGAGSGAARREALRAPPPDAELLQFAASLSATKRLFASLLDQLCDEPDFAHHDNEQCWNGNAIGDYTKPLVASSSVSDQNYNPEEESAAPRPRAQDTQLVMLGDQLRQATQLLVSSAWGDAPASAAEAFMQGDEAGEGSGSGRGDPPYDDADAEGSGEEGSGRPDLIGRTRTLDDRMDASPPRTGGGAAARPTAALLALVLLAARA